MGDPLQDDWLKNPIIGVLDQMFDAAAPAAPGASPGAAAAPATTSQTTSADTTSPTDKATDPTATPTSAPGGADQAADAIKDVLLHYASDNLKSFEEKQLSDLAKAWKENPAAVITAGTIIGSAGVAYLVGTKGSLPSLPSIPLDFLAGKVPAFRGAEAKITVAGPITNPTSFSVSITFHEQAPKKPKSSGGKGQVFTPRLTLASAKASTPESGAELNIEGQVPIPSNAKPEDSKATSDAIEDGRIEVDIGGSPAGLIDVVSVTDNFQPDAMGLRAPPLNRAIAVRLRTSIPPMFHQGPDEVTDQSITVRINGVSSEGNVTIKAHVKPAPAPAGGSGS